MTHRPPSIGRRTALQALGSLTLATVAGCLGNQSTGTSRSTTTSTSGPFANIAIHGTTLVVDLAENAGVGHVNLVKPNGSLFGKRGVAHGASRVSFDVGTTYTPGQYTLVAVNGNQTIGTTTQSLHPDLQIRDMGIGRNQPEQMWNGTKHRIGDEAFVTVANRGSGPTAVTKLLFFGMVPYPSGKNGTEYANNPGVSGIYDPESDSEVDHVVVPPGQQRTIYSYRSPFGFVPGVGTNCQKYPQSGTFTLSLETSVTDQRVSKKYGIHYTAAKKFNNCTLMIQQQTNG